MQKTFYYHKLVAKFQESSNLKINFKKIILGFLAAK
jgi:hypothetical protein